MLLPLLLLFTAIPSVISEESPSSLPVDETTVPLEETPVVAEAIDDSPLTKEKEEVNVWGEWSVETPCTDSCGACGRVHYTRDCLCAGEEGCPCSERESRIEICGTTLCQFPRRTCCEGFKKIATAKELKCGPITDSVERTILEKENAAVSRKAVDKKKETHSDSPVEKGEDSVWSDWIATTACSDTCGSCGRVTMIRDCLCAGEEECPCSKRQTRIDICGTGLCQFPRRTCCDGFKREGRKCIEAHPPPPTPTTTQSTVETVNEVIEVIKTTPEAPKQRAAKTHVVQTNEEPVKEVNEGEKAVWSKWIVSTPCTDNCGACGTMELTRECLCAGEEDCPCSERQSRTDVCGTNLCQFPRHTCCPGFKKTHTRDGFKCASEEGEAPNDNVIVSTPTRPPVPSVPARKLFNREQPVERKEELPVEGVSSDAPSVWSAWIVTTPCTDTCGGCGRIHLIRECLCAGEEGCPCSEAETRVEVCASEMCHFPRDTCCKGLKKTLTYTGFRCVATEDKESICTGRWTPWVADSSVAECPSKCGMCGKRRVATRKCEPAGCECTGDTQLFEPCGGHPCREGPACCEGFVKGRVDGREECVPNASIPPALSVASRKFLERKKEEEKKVMESRKSQLKQILPVLSSPAKCTWGEWVEVESECSGSCGMCGVRVSARRSCYPEGCNCAGPSTRYEDCGEGVCEGRDKQCCGFYVPSLVNGVKTCIDPVEGVEEQIIKPKKKREFAQQRKIEHKEQLTTSTCRGVWSSFTASPVSSCDNPCGLCGHRVVAERQCLPEGCTCDGSNKLYERCGEKPCWNKKDGCCEGASLVLVDGKRICKEIN